MRRTVRSCRKRVLKRRLRFRHQKRQKRSRKRCSINAFSTQALLIVSTAKPPGPHSCVVAKSDEIGDAEATLRCGRPGSSRSHRARLRPRHMRCSALPSLSAVVVLSLTFPRQSPRESPSRHLALLCVFRTHRMCVLNGVFQRRTTDRMRDRERASSPRSHCFLLTSNCFVTV